MGHKPSNAPLYTNNMDWKGFNAYLRSNYSRTTVSITWAYARKYSPYIYNSDLSGLGQVEGYSARAELRDRTLSAVSSLKQESSNTVHSMPNLTPSLSFSRIANYDEKLLQTL